ncbi:MAG: hypothetical protein ACREA0_18175 [bacterium]
MRVLASVFTFYRLLRTVGETRGQRNELILPVASGLCQARAARQRPARLWFWDIKFKGPAN